MWQGGGNGKITSDYQSIARDFVLGFAADPAMKNQLLKLPHDKPLTEREQQLTDLLNKSLDVVRVYAPGVPDWSEQRHQLFTKGTLPWQSLIEGQTPDDYRKYAEIIKVMAVEKAAGQPVDLDTLQNKWMGKDGYQVLQQAIAQKGELRTEDLARSFVLSGSPISAELLDKLSGMNATDIAAVKNSYATKYRSDLDSDLLSKVPAIDRSDFIERLRSFSTDSGEQFLNNQQTWLDLKGGHAPDASPATAQRTLDLTGDAIASGKLDQQSVDKLNSLFKDAALDYTRSRSEYAAKLQELAAAANLTIGLASGSALATFIFTEAASTAIKKASLGSDFKFDAVSFLQDAVTSLGMAKFGEYVQSINGAKFINEATETVQEGLGPTVSEAVSKADLRSILADSAQAGRSVTAEDFASLNLQDPSKAADLANHALTAAAQNPSFVKGVVDNVIQSTAMSAMVSVVHGSFDLSLLKDNVLQGTIFLGAGQGLHTLKLLKGVTGKFMVEPVGGVQEMTVAQSNGETRTVKFEDGATESYSLNATDKIVSIDGQPVTQKVMVNSSQPVEQPTQSATPAEANQSHQSDFAPPTTVPPSDSANSLPAKVNAELQQSFVKGPATQELVTTLKSKGVTDTAQLEASLASSDISSYSMGLLTKMASEAKNPDQVIKDAIAWSKGDAGMTDLLKPYQSQLSDLLYSRSGNAKMIDSMLTNLPAQEADAKVVLGLIDKSLKGEIVLVDGTGDFPKDRGPYNPKGSGDVCTAATSAWVQNQLLTESQVLDVINKSLTKPLYKNLMTDVVPVLDGKPMITAENVQSLYGYADTVTNGTGTYYDAYDAGWKYVENTSGLKLTTLNGSLASAHDGMYVLMTNMEHPKGWTVPHAMSAVVKDGIVTYYDPLNGKSSSVMPASYTFKSAWSVGPVERR